jgi:hypothetical protein
MTQEEANEYCTPTEAEQTLLILQDKCPHNKGWRYFGHGHNDEIWQCNYCNQTKSY